MIMDSLKGLDTEKFDKSNIIQLICLDNSYSRIEMSLFLKEKKDVYDNYFISFNGAMDDEKMVLEGPKDIIHVHSKYNLILLDSWTISVRFIAPLATTEDWRALTKAYNGDHHVIVSTDDLLGTFDNSTSNGFISCGFFMSTLSKGEHILVAIGKNQKTYFFIDGKYVGVSDYQSKSDICCFGGSFGDRPFGTTLYDFRVYDVDLKDDEVVSLCSAKEIIPEPQSEHLKLWLKIDGKTLVCEKDEKYPKFKPLSIDVKLDGVELDKNNIGIQFSEKYQYCTFEKSSIKLPTHGYTISCFFMAPFKSDKNWKTLTRGSSHDFQVIISKEGELGLYNNFSDRGFLPCGYNVKNLKKGPHHLCSIAANNVTSFYIDGIKDPINDC